MNRTGLFGKTLLFAACLLLAGAEPSRASAADPFGEGRMRFSLIVGNGTAFDQDYFVAGLGFGYFVAKGIEIGLEGESWSGSSPRIVKVSPQARFIVPAEGPAKPYVGAFYRRTVVQGRDDLNSAGARAGIYVLSGGGGYFGAGVVYENYFSCNDAVYRSCTEAYPELMFAISF